MYRPDLDKSDKGGAIAAVIAIHALLLFVLLHMSGRMDLTDPQSVLRVFDVAVTPPAPPPPLLQAKQSKPRDKEGGSAPKNIKSEATPIVAPKPRIVTPPVRQVAASDRPRAGAQSTQGASDMAGPGTGAGGSGNGAGSGEGGSGPGGGGDSGIAEPPHLATPVLSGRDIPREALDRWPRGATVFMRLRIDARGAVSECAVDRGTGNPAIDSTLCNLAHERLRFRPAFNRAGQPVAGWFGYAQPAPR